MIASPYPDVIYTHTFFKIFKLNERRKKSMNNVKLLIRIPEDLKVIIKIYAKKTNQSVNSAIIELIKNGYLKSLGDDK